MHADRTPENTGCEDTSLKGLYQDKVPTNKECARDRIWQHERDENGRSGSKCGPDHGNSFEEESEHSNNQAKIAQAKHCTSSPCQDANNGGKGQLPTNVIAYLATQCLFKQIDSWQPLLRKDADNVIPDALAIQGEVETEDNHYKDIDNRIRHKKDNIQNVAYHDIGSVLQLLLYLRECIV